MRGKVAITVILLWGITLSLCLGQDLANIKDAKPITVKGNIGLSSSFYEASGIPDRQAPFAYGITANATISLYGIDMPFSFVWFDNNKKGNFSQPFNQFGVSPTYKWLTLHLGYRNMSFSEFTLNGYTFLGAGVEAKPGKWRLGGMYGKFNQNSIFDLAMADSLPKLTRLGWATKIGYGTEKRFVDISILRISDNTSNFDITKYKEGMPMPEENLALGLTSKMEITSKLVFTFDGSYSFMTLNSTNKSRARSDAMLDFAGNFMTINSTSDYYAAFKTSINYKFTPTVITGLEYRRIDPGFRSMGSYFFNNDIEHITLNQTLSLYQNKINLRGSLGIQRDNLDRSKENTANRIIGYLSGSYNINQNWAVDASFNNFSTQQRAIKSISTNELLIKQVNQTFTLSPRFMKATPKLTHMVMLNLNLSVLEDKNKKTAGMTNTDTYMTMLVYNMGVPAHKLNFSSGLNYTLMDNKNLQNELMGGNINVSKVMLNDKLTTGWNNSLMLNKLNKDSGLIYNTTLNAAYRIHTQHTMSLNLNFINNQFAKGASVPSFNETRGDISYVFTF